MKHERSTHDDHRTGNTAFAARLRVLSVRMPRGRFLWARAAALLGGDFARAESEIQGDIGPVQTVLLR